MSRSESVMIVAGEASGDRHAAGLVEQAKALRPDLEFFGVGGPAMEASGVRIHYPTSVIAHMGFVEVIAHLPAIIRVFLDLLNLMRRERPRWIVLIDAPEFNLTLARFAQRMGIKVLYYVSPQVWAWRRGRVHRIASKVDTLMCLFPFEPAMYDGTGLDARFVGHPLLDHTEASYWEKAPEPQRKGVVALIPGSRQGEIERMLPVLLQTAYLLSCRFEGLKFLLSVAPGADEAAIDSRIASNPDWAGLTLEKTRGGAAVAVRRASFSLVTSGTSTLESGLVGGAMAIVYKVSGLTWLLARLLVKVQYIGLVNWVLGDRVVPEKLQEEAQPEPLAELVGGYLANPKRIRALERALIPVRDALGGGGASKRAAEILLEKLEADQ